MITVYRGTDGDISPVRLECEEFGWPHKTTCGERMYGNTHFLTEADAWDSILKSVRAGVELANIAVENYKSKLAEAEQRADRANLDFIRAEDEYVIWKG